MTTCAIITRSILKPVVGKMLRLDGTHIFPVLIIGLSAAAGIAYLCSGDWRRGFYWLFAAGLGVCVTC